MSGISGRLFDVAIRLMVVASVNTYVTGPISTGDIYGAAKSIHGSELRSVQFLTTNVCKCSFVDNVIVLVVVTYSR